MGSGRWDAKDWASYSANAQTKTQQQIFTSSSMSDDLNPKKFSARESRDSELNPASTPIILATDVTGSMGYLAEQIVKTGLGTIMKEIYDRRPVTDPHIACAGIGDAFVDSAPFQMTQFEAEVAPLTTQLEKLYIEHGGGGNGGESYLGAWYAAAFKTSCDAIEKRGRKGYLFTMGDERCHDVLTGAQIKAFFGGTENPRDLSARQLLDACSKDWEVFHLIVGQYTYHNSEAAWKKLLGERAIVVSDESRLAEIIVSTIQVVEGASLHDVADSWSGDTAVAVRSSLSSLSSSRRDQGVVAL